MRAGMRSRHAVVALTVVLILEAGAVAPASVVLGAPHQGPIAGSPALAAEIEPIELVGERTADSRTFDNLDGTFTTELFPHAVYYQPGESDDWMPIDVGFQPSDTDGLTAVSDKAPVVVGVRQAGDARGYLSLETSDMAIGVRLLGAVGKDGALVSPEASKEPALDGAIASYAAVLPDVDLQVHAGPTGVKSFLVLHSLAAATAFAFAIDAPGITLVQAADGGAQLITDDGQLVGRIPVPYLVDSGSSEERGSGRFGDEVSLTVAKIGGEQAVVLAVDPLWLAAATYPVYVDPSITFDSTTESFDAFVSAAYPTMNFANYVRPDSPFYHEHWLGKDPTNSTNVNEVFLKFDLASIADVEVDSATLEVYPYHQYYNAPTATNTWLNRVNGSWTESGLTWNNKPGSTWVNTEALVEGQTGSFNLKPTVQSWVDGSVANHGVKLHESGNDATYWKRLISSEEGGGNVPSLVVTYHRPTAAPSSAGWTNTRTLTWTYADPESDPQSHRQVQVSTSSSFSSILSDSGVLSGTSTSWSIPAGVTLTNGTQYYWRVKVKNGTGWSVWADSGFIWDTSAPTGTVTINSGQATTDTSTVRVSMNALDPNTTEVYANEGRSLTSVVGCGSVVCGGYATPAFSNSRATGAVLAVANTGATDTWHSVTIDANASNRPTLAMDVRRESTTATHIGVVGDDNDGFRLQLRTAAGNANFTTLGWTDSTTPGSFATRTVNLPFTPGVWYRVVLAASGTTGGGAWSMWWYPRDSAQPTAPTEIVHGVNVPKPRLHAFLVGSQPSPDALYLDNVEVSQNGAGGPYGSGAVAVRFSPDNTTWGNWTGYADDLNYVLPAGSGTKNVYAQFRDAAGNVSSSVSDTISVAFGNLGRQPQHRFETWDLGAGDELAVNVENGNLVLTHPLVDLPYRGSNTLPLTLTHNSQAADNAGLGPGWQLDVQRRLILNGDSTVTFVAADGARHTFTAPVTVGTVTTYTRPASLYATLVKDTAQGIEFTLTYRDQRRDRFDISASIGRLASIEDRHGNAIAIAYDGSGNLVTATDPAARQVSFTWDTAPTPDRLTSVADWAWIDASGIVQTSATGSRRSYRFFFDASGNLSGWSDPLNTVGACPTNASHLTCLGYTTGLLSGVSKTQTYTTFDPGNGSLGTATRLITTAISSAGSRVASVADAESKTTTLVPDGSDRLVVRRPATTTAYNFQATADAYARVANVWRQLDALTEIEQRTTWDSAYPIEPATVTDNYGGLDDAPARTLSSTYQAASMGLLAKLVEPLTATDDRWTEHTYNANNDITQTIVSLEGSGTERRITRYCYDAGCNLTGNGLLLLNEIHNFISGAATDDDTNVAVEYGYDSAGQRTLVTRHNRDDSGATLDDREDRFTFDVNGNITAEIVNYANGTVTSPGDDITPNGATQARSDLTTAHAYDTASNLVSTADPRRAIDTAKGVSLAADDYVTRWTYDALDQRVTEKTPTTPALASMQRTASMTHDELGGLRNATDFGLMVTATEFDRIGRALRTFEDPNPPGSASETSIATYDADGNLLTAKDRAQAADPGLGQTVFSYDAIGRQISATSADGTASQAQDAQTYDGLDRLTILKVGVGSPASLVTLYVYDVGGRLTAVDDGFACTTETFDYRDLSSDSTSGLAGGTCATAADKRVLTHTYDGLGRRARSEVTYGAGTGDRTLDDVFDAVGNRRVAGVRVSGVSTATIFGVNLLDQVWSEARADASTAKSNYDPVSNPTDSCYWAPSVTVGGCYAVGTTPWSNPPTTSTTTAYDARGQRISLTDAAAGSTTTYDPDHNYLIQGLYRTTASGREQQALYSYDTRHRLTNITFQTCTATASHACTDAPVSNGSDSYAYDDNDNRIQVVENNQATTSDRRYCYDARNELIYRNTGAACASGANDERWTYDAAGNRLSANSGGSTTNFAYNASGLLCDAETGAVASCSGGNVTHDTAGRINSWNGWTFAYDAESRLVSACKSLTCAPGYDKVTFAYDGEGHRTRITTMSAGGSTSTTEFRYQGNAVVEEKVSGTVVQRFVTDESGTISKLIVPTGQPYAGTYLVNWNGHGDALNLLQVNGDGTTTLANSFTYDSWGRPTTSTHNSIGDLGFRYLYVGEFDVQWDDSFGLGLHYMHARHYAPSLGRFLQPDPAALENNLHAYVANSPVTGTDPSGLWKGKGGRGGGGASGGGGGWIRVTFKTQAGRGHGARHLTALGRGVNKGVVEAELRRVVVANARWMSVGQTRYYLAFAQCRLWVVGSHMINGASIEIGTYYPFWKLC